MVAFSFQTLWNYGTKNHSEFVVVYWKNTEITLTLKNMENTSIITMKYFSLLYKETEIPLK